MKKQIERRLDALEQATAEQGTEAVAIIGEGNPVPAGIDANSDAVTVIVLCSVDADGRAL